MFSVASSSLIFILTLDGGTALAMPAPPGRPAKMRAFSNGTPKPDHHLALVGK
jgi:hypothetical protein